MSNNNSNQPVVTSAREALNKFKMEAAQEVGVDLKQGYNGHLTSREAGSVGGQMVKNMKPARKTSFARASRTMTGHMREVNYITSVTL